MTTETLNDYELGLIEMIRNYARNPYNVYLKKSILFQLDDIFKAIQRDEFYEEDYTS